MVVLDEPVTDELPTTIRALAAHELAAVERVLPKAHLAMHAERLADQYAGQVLYLIAWLGERPVGHVLLRWRGSTNPALRPIIARYGRHPYLEDLFVLPDARSRTIGSQLLVTAEQQSSLRGHNHVGLAVAPENVRARALYERHGYRDAEVGQFQSRWSRIDDAGRLHSGVEECVYLIKETGVRSQETGGSSELDVGRSKLDA
jgi:GNAT superfamily N-acetyltransferase